MALMQIIDFDEDGNCLNGSFMDYLIPTSMETPDWELGETVTPSPHHPLGAKGVGESATVGSPPAVVNAVLDAIGARNVDIPPSPARGGERRHAAPARAGVGGPPARSLPIRTCRPSWCALRARRPRAPATARSS